MGTPVTGCTYRIVDGQNDAGLSSARGGGGMIGLHPMRRSFKVKVYRVPDMT